MKRVWVDLDLRSDLRARGIKQSSRFTWHAAARETAATYQTWG
jgi:hypothetical protein